MTGKKGMFAVVGLAAVAGAAGLSGCIVSSGRNNCGPTDVTFSWTLADTNGVHRSCAELGAASVAIHVGAMAALFNCNDGAGVTNPLTPGTYDVSFQLLDANGNVISSAPARSTVIPACGIDLGNVPFMASLGICDTQDVSLSWHIVRTNGATLSCAQAAASTVRLNMGAMVADFACTDGHGTSPPVADGTYDTSMLLLNAAGNTLSMTEHMNITVPRCAGITLGEIEFPVF